MELIWVWILAMVTFVAGIAVAVSIIRLQRPKVIYVHEAKPESKKPHKPAWHMLSPLTEGTDGRRICVVCFSEELLVNGEWTPYNDYATAEFLGVLTDDIGNHVAETVEEMGSPESDTDVGEELTPAIQGRTPV